MQPSLWDNDITCTPAVRATSAVPSSLTSSTTTTSNPPKTSRRATSRSPSSFPKRGASLRAGMTTVNTGAGGEGSCTSCAVGVAAGAGWAGDGPSSASLRGLPAPARCHATAQRVTHPVWMAATAAARPTTATAHAGRSAHVFRIAEGRQAIICRGSQGWEAKEGRRNGGVRPPQRRPRPTRRG